MFECSSNIQNKKTFAIGEELIKPCIVAASKEILGSKAAQKLKKCASFE